MTTPEAITDHLITQAKANGAVIKEFTPALRVQGGAKSFTVHTKPVDRVNARCVVNSLGPWLGTLELPRGLSGPRPQWCKGFNLIIKQQLDPTYGVGVQSSDGRLFFCVPRESGSAIGTWYFPHADASTPSSVSEHEVAQFLHAFNAALPEAKVSKSDIIGIDVGILPMAKTGPQGPQLIAHERIHSREGYIEVMSTKYTTFRSQGKTVLLAVRRALA